ncbi:hypothetical protein Pmani_010374 [Petrolisthes manimaculis]|uniref:Uncharacterized protein n=1 Tax=Petrolisthes manimaculis TaxID=1843537 RepID=A0AAE1Q549_9EUCA|nr:hypothetical protein Pmani_010374 [Petrolisthes manimaculis]
MPVLQQRCHVQESLKTLPDTHTLPAKRWSTFPPCKSPVITHCETKGPCPFGNERCIDLASHQRRPSGEIWLVTSSGFPVGGKGGDIVAQD